MEEGFTRKEKLAGLFLLMVVLITKVTLLVVAQGKGWFQSQRVYLVRFKQGYNLHPGSLVKMFNTEAGKVANMRLSRVMDETQVEVTVKVLTEYADLIRQDSVAEVVSPTFIGSEYIDISPGSSGYPQIEEYGVIPSRLRKSMMENLGELANEETLREVKTTLSNIAQLSSQLKDFPKPVLTAVDQVNVILAHIVEAKGALGQLVMQKDLHARLVQSVEQLNRTLAEVQGMVGEMKPVAQNLQTFTQDLNREMETIRAILADVKGSSQDLPGLVESAQDAARSGKEVLDAVKANPLIKMTAPKDQAPRGLHVDPRAAP